MTPKEMEENNQRIEKCESAVSDWIKKHAAYPESYIPIEFSEYGEAYMGNGSEKIPNSESYSIHHTHRIKNINGDTTTFSGYFILQYDYFVDIIEDTKTNSAGGAFPPRLEIWLSKFGRPLTKEDSLEWDARIREETKKVLKELTEGLENGNSYIKEGNKDSLKNILDSIKK